MRPIRAAGAAITANLPSIGSLLRRHAAVARVGIAALSFTLLVVLTQQASTQAGPEATAPVIRESLLPLSVGIGVATDAAINIPLGEGVETAAIESRVDLIPDHPVTLAWSADGTELTLRPQTRWRADERYLVVMPDAVAGSDGSATSARRFAFTTRTAPVITDFQVRLADEATAVLTPPDGVPSADALVVDDDRAAKTDAVDRSARAGQQLTTETPNEVSATSAIVVSFSDEMDRADTEDHFVIRPEMAGELGWRGRDLIFSPSERLAPGARYTVSLIGAHDAAGNVLGGKENFSFVVQPGAQLTRTAPEAGATDVEPPTLEAWFSQPMNVDAAGAALEVTNATSGDAVAGSVTWNAAGTQLSFTPEAPFQAGATFDVAFGLGATDVDGNQVAMEWSFSTNAAPAPEPVAAASTAPAASVAPAAAPAAAPPAPAPVVPPAAPAGSAGGYAVNQINAARAAYGFGPVVLDDAISAVAYAHAYDQAVNNYFSHTGLNGSTRDSRLRAGGISFGWSGENQCYLVGRSPEATLDWCHSAFMAEPYPGHWNHIANILDPRARRVGVGIAQVGSKIVIVWDFTD